MNTAGKKHKMDFIKSGDESPIKTSGGIALHNTELRGIARVEVLNSSAVQDLPWDRYMRLSRTAQEVVEFSKQANMDPASSILDVGGFDGALGFFLLEQQLHLLDPLTTGGTATAIAASDQSYDLVVSVDALEHVTPEKRYKFVAEMTRVTRKAVFLNYPGAASMKAQELVLKLTGNPYIAEHIEYSLPDTNEVVGWLADFGFKTRTMSHTSVAIWVAQFTLSALASDAGKLVSKYLIENNRDEAGNLYDLIVAHK